MPAGQVTGFLFFAGGGEWIVVEGSRRDSSKIKRSEGREAGMSIEWRIMEGGESWKWRIVEGGG